MSNDSALRAPFPSNPQTSVHWISQADARNLELDAQEQRLATSQQGDYVLKCPRVLDFLLVRNADSSLDAIECATARHPVGPWEVVTSVPAGSHWAIAFDDEGARLAYLGLDG